MPYQMGRVNQTFGYSYYIDDVRRDIELARRMKTLREQAEEHSVLAEGGLKAILAPRLDTLKETRT